MPELTPNQIKLVVKVKKKLDELAIVENFNSLIF
jgi:hypothetical protein